MSRLRRHLHAHPHLVAALVLGVAAALVTGGQAGLSRQVLVGWNAAVWGYLAFTAFSVWRADAGHVQRVAEAQAEGAFTVLAVAIVASVAGLVGVVLELSAAKAAGAAGAWQHVAFALSTVLGSWLLLGTMFALAYASLYFRAPRSPVLLFPGAAAGSHPDFGDFLYFAFTIAVALQTADVAVAGQRVRRWVLAQSLVSFGFNTAVLALSINMVAGLF